MFNIELVFKKKNIKCNKIVLQQRTMILCCPCFQMLEMVKQIVKKEEKEKKSSKQEHHKSKCSHQ